jgi:hypothetical protein
MSSFLTTYAAVCVIVHVFLWTLLPCAPQGPATATAAATSLWSLVMNLWGCSEHRASPSSPPPAPSMPLSALLPCFRLFLGAPRLLGSTQDRHSCTCACCSTRSCGCIPGVLSRDLKGAHTMHHPHRSLALPAALLALQQDCLAAVLLYMPHQ